MKKIIFLFLLTSCTCTEVIQTKSVDNLPLTKKDGFVFENDTLIVKYSFWSSYGSINISVYNKLNKPIYVDWGNSSSIENDVAMPVWQDQTLTNSNTVAGGYSRYNNNQSISVAESQTNVSTYTPLRIVSIPPRAEVYKRSTQICNNNFIPIVTEHSTYDYANSPIRLRVYIAVALDRDLKNIFYIDEQFYVYNTKYISTDEFQGRFQYPFRRPDLFYIEGIQGYVGMSPYDAYGNPIDFK